MTKDEKVVVYMSPARARQYYACKKSKWGWTELVKTAPHVSGNVGFYCVLAGFVLLLIFGGMLYDSGYRAGRSEAGKNVLWLDAAPQALLYSWSDLGKMGLWIAFPFIILAWVIHGVGFRVI